MPYESRRIVSAGSDNWQYRSGYKDRQRVPMAILPMQQPSLWQRVMVWRR
jgi:hypothetical protein